MAHSPHEALLPRSPPKSLASNPMSPSPSNVSLPDLTDRLIENGLYNKYLKFREGYRRWRKGNAKGAKGELTVDEFARQLSEEADELLSRFEYWYPTAGSYRFRRTISYWIPVLYMEGTTLFAIGCFFALYDFHGDSLLEDALVGKPFVIGCLQFNLGAYLGIFEIINLPQDLHEDGTTVYWSWDFKKFTQVTDWRALAAFMVSFGACVFFTLSCSFAPLLPPSWKFWTVVVPYNIGGLGFLLGALLEMSLNSVHKRPFRINEVAWWTSLWHFLGCFLFFFGGVAILPPVHQLHPQRADQFEQYFYCTGSIVFFFGTMGMFLLWKGEQYGLNLIRQLNVVLQQPGARVTLSKPQSPQRRPSVELVTSVAVKVPTTVSQEFGSTSGLDVRASLMMSWRGLLFQVVYIMAGVACVINGCLERYESQRFTAGQSVGSAIGSLGWFIQFVLLHMLLLLLSTGAKLPKEQPFRFLMILVRCMALALVLYSFLWLWFMLYFRHNFGLTSGIGSTMNV